MCLRNSKCFFYPLFFILFFIVVGCQSLPKKPTPIPQLVPKGNRMEFQVEGAPFLILGGELANSSFTSQAYMEPRWQGLKEMHLNTVLAPVYWELIEPQEGQFDFSLLETLVADARQHQLKLILLWFGTWKNAMSSHVPGWVKKDQVRFPRAKDSLGKSQEILSAFSQNNLEADQKAFEALMQFVKKSNEVAQTIIMIQPENEIGMLPSARDYSSLANAQFKAEVPSELMRYLSQNKDQLAPELAQMWAAQGYKTTGSWEVVFGSSQATDELFMAWHYGQYCQSIIASGKAIYPLPMFVNAALNAPGKKPGEYPSAAPLPHLFDVWKAAAPSIDFFAPDFYNPRFEWWCHLYSQKQNPLFIPEHRFDETVGPKALFAIGQFEALGFSPFSIDNAPSKNALQLKNVYALLEGIAPMLSEHRGKNRIQGVLLDAEKPEQKIAFGEYVFTVKNTHTLPWETQPEGGQWKMAGAILIQTDTDEFYLVGAGVVITFAHATDPTKIVGILKAEEGHFKMGQWEVLRHLNGDQTHQGRHIRIFHEQYMIQRFSLYTYQ